MKRFLAQYSVKALLFALLALILYGVLSGTSLVTILVSAPVRYVLLTAADIYGEEVNYTFSLSYPWGALVSCARFGDGHARQALLCYRAAKQSLCALIKSFGVPPSPDQNCVTSYTHDLAEFDAKGNRPNADTLLKFRAALTHYNGGWQLYRATKGLK